MKSDVKGVWSKAAIFGGDLFLFPFRAFVWDRVTGASSGLNEDKSSDMWGREVDSDSKAIEKKKGEKKIKPRQHEASRVNNEAHRRNAPSQKGILLTEVEKELCRAQCGGLDVRAARSEIVQVRVDDIGEVG